MKTIKAFPEAIIGTRVSAKRLRLIASLLFFILLNGVALYFVAPLIAALPFSEGSRELMHWGLYLVITLLAAFLFYTYSKINRRRKELERQVAQLETDLLKALHANDIKKKFIREIVHEIKSGFNPIEGMVAYLAEKERLQKAKVTPEQLIAHIKGGCSGYRRLLANLLEFSKIEFGKKEDLIIEPLEIRPFMQQAVNEFQYAAKSESTAIMLQIEEEVPPIIYCDPIKLRQIANNLIHNAIKFVRSGCDIVVKVELEDPHTWRLVVIHDGENIPEEQLQKIFQPYQDVRTGINMEGNGLGLFITRKLVESLQGNIEVIRPGKMFTVFEVKLPLEQRMAFSVSESA